MKVSNNIDYINKEQLETDITDLLYKLRFEPICVEVCEGLEEFRESLYSAREKYDKKRISTLISTKNRRKKK